MFFFLSSYHKEMSRNCMSTWVPSQTIQIKELKDDVKIL